MKRLTLFLIVAQVGGDFSLAAAPAGGLPQPAAAASLAGPAPAVRSVVPTDPAEDLPHQEDQEPPAMEDISERAPQFQAPLPPDRPEAPLTLYAAGNYRLRRAPNQRTLAVIPKGASFEVLVREGDWYKVRYLGKIGYVHHSGITHPMAEAIKKQKGLEALSQEQASELAACVVANQDSPLGLRFQDFIRTLQVRLEETASTFEAPLPVARRNVPVAEAPARAPSGRTHNESLLLGRPVIQRLRAEARAAAARPRSYAPHVCRRRGLRAPCGMSRNMHRSKGWCKAAVREALSRSLGIPPLPGGSAVSAGRYLETSNRFTRLAVSSCQAAPVGAVCVYRARHHRWGHIEIKADNNEYCSDYCAARPISRRNHTLVGVYYPSER